MAIKDLFRKKADAHALSQNSSDNAMITVTRLPSNYHADPAKMIAITDHRIIARITDAIPDLAQAGLQAQTAARYGGKALFEAILPPGADLKPHLKAGKDMFYGAGKAADGKDIFPDFHKLGPVNSATQIAAAAMNVASIVVGQYYMSQIDGELKAIKGTMQQLLNFQMDEYRSNIQALINQVTKIADHQAEVLMNDELRSRMLSMLDDCERKCDQLLEQANQALLRLSRTKSTEYSEYEQQVKEATEWYTYQQVLLNLQYQISNLAYTLMFGTVSQDFCFSNYSTSLSSAQSACAGLCAWHEAQIAHFGIDIRELTRKRKGLDAVLHSIPSLINRKLEQRPIDEEIVGMMLTQMHTPSDRLSNFQSKFELDTHILYDGEKLYYLKD